MYACIYSSWVEQQKTISFHSRHAGTFVLRGARIIAVEIPQNIFYYFKNSFCAGRLGKEPRSGVQLSERLPPLGRRGLRATPLNPPTLSY